MKIKMSKLFCLTIIAIVHTTSATSVQAKQLQGKKEVIKSNLNSAIKANYATYTNYNLPSDMYN